jgi:hypothetical protein
MKIDGSEYFSQQAYLQAHICSVVVNRTYLHPQVICNLMFHVHDNRNSAVLNANMFHPPLKMFAIYSHYMFNAYRSASRTTTRSSVVRCFCRAKRPVRTRALSIYSAASADAWKYVRRCWPSKYGAYQTHGRGIFDDFFLKSSLF